MFSVVIPLYNKELSIANTIQSVLNQTFQDFEIVVVNDGSTDRSAEIVESINDSRIRLIHQENQGVSAARNRGIEEAKYEWIAFLDGDDLWEKEHLETIKQMMELYPDDKVFTTSFIRNNQSMPEKKDNLIVMIENYFKEALNSAVTCSITICIHKSVFENVGVFNEKYIRGEDIDVWSRIARQYRFIKSSRITAIYREEAENRSDVEYVSVKKTYAGNISLRKTVDKHERKYYLYFITNNFKTAILNRKWNDILYMLFKYHYFLLTELI